LPGRGSGCLDTSHLLRFDRVRKACRPDGAGGASGTKAGPAVPARDRAVTRSSGSPARKSQPVGRPIPPPRDWPLEDSLIDAGLPIHCISTGVSMILSFQMKIISRPMNLDDAISWPRPDFVRQTETGHMSLRIATSRGGLHGSSISRWARSPVCRGPRYDAGSGRTGGGDGLVDNRLSLALHRHRGFGCTRLWSGHHFQSSA
jgi:hypothetical protein